MVLPENRAQTLTLIRSKLDHDLRSNLNVILGYCSMLTEDVDVLQDTSQLAGDLACIAAAGQELLHLNGQVGDLIEIQQGKWKLAPGEVVVDYVVQDAIDAVSERFPAHNFDLFGSARIDGDSRTIYRLLSWLVTQLCKATSIPSSIELHIEASSDAVAVDISCQLDESSEAEQRKLQRVLNSLLVPVPVLNSIQDFEGYYRSVMCEMVGAEIDADSDRLGCRVTLPGTMDIAEETNGETTAG